MPSSDGPKTARTQKNIEKTRQNVDENKKTSIRIRAQELCLNGESFKIIITKG